MSHNDLKRSLGLPIVTFYGLGTIIGAGIYVLISEIASVSGTLMPLAFVTAGIIAAGTGACYGELCARHPQAAGAVLYVDVAFGNATLTRISAVLLLLTGIVSAATISKGFVGYLDLYIQPPEAITIMILVGAMTLIAVLGIDASAWTVAVITLIEVSGLLLVITLTSTAGHTPVEVTLPEPWLTPVLMGAYLAFYAFIGFEDMVNLAEETHNPQTTIPRALMLAIAGASLLYMAIAVTAVVYMEVDQLAQSQSPLALMVGHSPAAVKLMALVGMIAITNGALTQIIMSSRVIFGMARRGLLPHAFAHVHPATRTPVTSTVMVGAIILGFALWLPLVTLAQLTSAIMLIVFALVNLSLLRIKRTEPGHTGFTIPRWIPLLALILNLLLFVFQISATLTP